MTFWPLRPKLAGVQACTSSSNGVPSYSLIGNWTGAPKPFRLSQQRMTGIEETANLLKHRPRVKIYTHTSGQHGLIGIRVVIIIGNKTRKSISRTIGKHEEINVYFAQIRAILETLSLTKEIFKITPALKNVIEVVIYSSGQSALRSILKPYLQSGQAAIQEVTSRLTTLQQGDIKETSRSLSNGSQHPMRKRELNLPKQQRVMQPEKDGRSIHHGRLERSYSQQPGE
jgi:hypothetical protein